MNLIRPKQVAKKYGVHISTPYDWLDPKSPNYDPEFPKPIKMFEGSRATFFIEEELDAHIAKKASRRDLARISPAVAATAARRRGKRVDGTVADMNPSKASEEA